jgi:PhnB protein
VNNKKTIEGGKKMSLSGVGLYVMNSIEAVEMYQSAFGLKLGYHVLNKDGSYFHSELCKEGEEVFSVVEDPSCISTVNPVQLCFTFDGRDELVRAFNILTREGKITMDICELPWSPCAAEVLDKFGIRWYLTVPQHRPPETFTPEDCKAHR